MQRKPIKSFITSSSTKIIHSHVSLLNNSRMLIVQVESTKYLILFQRRKKYQIMLMRGSETNSFIPSKKIIRLLLLLSGLITFKGKQKMLFKVHGRILYQMEPKLSCFRLKDPTLLSASQKELDCLEDQILQKKDSISIKVFLMWLFHLMKPIWLATVLQMKKLTQALCCGQYSHKFASSN